MTRQGPLFFIMSWFIKPYNSIGCLFVIIKSIALTTNKYEQKSPESSVTAREPCVLTDNFTQNYDKSSVLANILVNTVMS